MRRLVILVVCSAVFYVTGCTSAWQQYYKPIPSMKGVKFAPTESSQIRSVEPERLAAWLADTRERRARSDTAMEDLTLEDRILETNRLLDTLRIKERAPDVRIMGFSEFLFGVALPLDDPQLIKFAKQIGADYVVVACGYAGQGDQVALIPVTTYSRANATASAVGSDGRRASGYASGSGTSTTLQPLQVKRNFFAHYAVFVRRVRPSDPPIK